MLRNMPTLIKRLMESKTKNYLCITKVKTHIVIKCLLTVFVWNYLFNHIQMLVLEAFRVFFLSHLEDSKLLATFHYFFQD